MLPMTNGTSVNSPATRRRANSVRFKKKIKKREPLSIKSSPIPPSRPSRRRAISAPAVPNGTKISSAALGNSAPKITKTLFEDPSPTTHHRRKSIESPSKIEGYVEDCYPGSDSDQSSDSDSNSSSSAGTTNTNNSTQSNVFRSELSLFSPQKLISTKRVSKEDVVDTVFSALFTKTPRRRRVPSWTTSEEDSSSCSGGGTSTDGEDRPNELAVKQGLAKVLFNEKASLVSPQADIFKAYVTPSLIDKLVTELRFEDFRVASSRIDILRAIHKKCSERRVHLAKAVADAAALRLMYVKSLVRVNLDNCSDNLMKADSAWDHGHGLLELLRFLIERPPHSDCNYVRALVSLCQGHTIDSSGTDEEELLDCAGQFVAYVPDCCENLVRRILQSVFSSTQSSVSTVFSLRLLGRVLMSSSSIANTLVIRKVFQRIACCIRSSNIQVAIEAIRFGTCPFMLNQYVAFNQEAYRQLSSALHQVSTGHWNETVRNMATEHFDIVLDYAP